MYHPQSNLSIPNIIFAPLGFFPTCISRIYISQTNWYFVGHLKLDSNIKHFSFIINFLFL